MSFVTQGSSGLQACNPLSHSLKPLATTSKKAIASIPISTLPQNTQSKFMICSFFAVAHTWSGRQDGISTFLIATRVPARLPGYPARKMSFFAR